MISWAYKLSKWSAVQTSSKGTSLMPSGGLSGVIILTSTRVTSCSISCNSTQGKTPKRIWQSTILMVITTFPRDLKAPNCTKSQEEYKTSKCLSIAMQKADMRTKTLTILHSDACENICKSVMILKLCSQASGCTFIHGTQPTLKSCVTWSKTST